jgi:antitoxin component YwqK of YwqJK toxin-antitoxin module
MLKRSRGHKHIHYHKDGTIWAKGSMLNGKMDGSWVWFRKDGSKMRSGHFDRGRQVGEWITYDKRENIVKKTMFGR